MVFDHLLTGLNKINFKRRLLSILLVLIIFYLDLHLPAKVFAYFIIGLALLALIFDLIRRKNGGAFLKRVINMYPSETYENDKFLSDITVFLFSTTILFFVFPKTIFLISIIIYILADNCGHILGVLIHKGKLFWNKDKTILGAIGNVLGVLISLTIISQALGVKLDIIPIAIISLAVIIIDSINAPDNILMPWVISIILLFSIN